MAAKLFYVLKLQRRPLLEKLKATEIITKFIGFYGT
jgi:hypothetical protein